MKIGFFYPTYYPLTASASVHGYYLAKELAKRGHTLLTATQDMNPDCVKFPANPRGMVQLARQADVLYVRVMDYFEHVAFAKFIKPFRLPVVWEVNAPVEELLAANPSDPQLQQRVRQRLWVRRQIGRLVDACVCVSEPLVDYVRTAFGITKVFCVPNASDPLLFKRQRTLPQLLERVAYRFKIVWAGNPALPWQAIDPMLALADRMAVLDPEMVFIAVCAEGQWRAAPRPNIITVSPVSHHAMPDYLTNADCCLCLYHQPDWSPCGFYQSPLKLFDYMAAGKPVIASRLGQITTVIEDGRNGLLTDASLDHMVTLLRELKTRPQLQQRLGAAARSDVQRYYNWQRAGAQVDAVLRSVIPGRGR